MTVPVAAVDVHRVETLANSDLAQLCNLHAANLPGSLVTNLGPSALKAYYRFVGGSDPETLFIARTGSKIVGACVLSSQPDTVTRRFVCAKPVEILPRLAISAATSSTTRKAVFDVFSNR